MTIQEKIGLLPEKPGCYLYLNAQNKIIYVGKAKNLKDEFPIILPPF
jgi:excinuclease ABC subunit C